MVFFVWAACSSLFLLAINYLLQLHIHIVFLIISFHEKKSKAKTWRVIDKRLTQC
jgi:hypothetical protein